MISTPIWDESLMRLAIAVTGMLLTVGMTRRWLPRPADQRSVWRFAFVALLLLVPLELTGFVPAALGWRRPTMPTVADDLADITPIMPIAERTSPSHGSWLATIWAAGLLAVMARWAVGMGLLCWLRGRLQPVHSPDLRRRVHAIAQLSGCSPAVVGWTRSLNGPFVFGTWRPVLVLPARFEQELSPAEQDAVLAHELSHLASRDMTWQHLVDVLVAVFWWHPLAWWARRQYREACESAADEATIHLADGPGLLAEYLVRYGRRLVASRPLATYGAGGVRRSPLGRRIEHLLELGERIPNHPVRRIAVAALLVSLATIAAISARPPTATLPSPFPAGPPQLLASKDMTPPRRATRNALSDDEIFSQLGLNANQWTKLTELRQHVNAETEIMHRLPSGRIQRGLAINRIWRSGLHSILTPTQYQRYLDYWRPAAVSPAARKVAAGG